MKSAIRLTAWAAATLLLSFQASAQAPQTPASAPTASPEALSVAHTIVDTAFPPERREEMMDKLMRAMGEQMKSAMPLSLMSDSGLAKIMTDYLAEIPTTLRPATRVFIPKQMDAVAQAYARMFTLPQLKDIATFAQTPSGRTYLQRSMDVMSDPAVAAVNTEYFAQTQALTQTSAGALSRRVADYLKAHPEVARSLSVKSGGNAE